MKISINQPAYLPWLGYFDRIEQSDIHVVLDNVQFEKNSMVNRNKVLVNGREVMLTIPLATKGLFGDLAINKIQVMDNKRWLKKHYMTLQQAYAKSPNKKEILPSLQLFYEQCADKSLLIEVLSMNLGLFLKLLNIKNTKIIYASELDAKGVKGELVLNICKELGATEYLSGPFGRDYLNRAAFESEGIKVSFHDYPHPNYLQRGQDSFHSHLSVVDLLLNEQKNPLDIIKGLKHV